MSILIIFFCFSNEYYFISSFHLSLDALSLLSKFSQLRICFRVDSEIPRYPRYASTDSVYGFAAYSAPFQLHVTGREQNVLVTEMLDVEGLNSTFLCLDIVGIDQ